MLVFTRNQLLAAKVHKQALLAVLEIAIISMVRAAQTEERIMTSWI